jgi:hypothetical protein
MTGFSFLTLFTPSSKNLIRDFQHVRPLIRGEAPEYQLTLLIVGTAHTTAYDFFTQRTESAFQVMNVLSDLGILRIPAIMDQRVSLPTASSTQKVQPLCLSGISSLNLAIAPTCRMR